MLAETGAGGRKGRGKRTKRKLKRDLNRGQKIGEGEKAAAPLSVFQSEHPQTSLLCLIDSLKQFGLKTKNPAAVGVGTCS